ncbi:hypothetical protein BKA64DRAFT_207629 [Cadophora sp. MPI-SDFR-AT-0126]|nr:hypothetical protein BKA64DRAFT_207629 [Leotiomycetes sp. MPI-SDFR-AT-0126]
MDRFQSAEFPGSEGSLGYWPVLHEDPGIVSSNINNASFSTAPSFTSLAAAEPLSAEPKRPVSNTKFSNGSEFCQEIIFDSPPTWRNSISLESQASPSTPFGEAVHPQTINAPTNEPLEFLPNRIIPRYHRSRELSETPNEPPKLDINKNGRDHPLYQNVTPHGDGLYHCPWEEHEECQHQPAKFKYEYNRYVDAHLKPYRCKVAVCGNLRFVSTACLLRHEREAHGLHGHGDRPYLCTYEGCKRSAPGNGFPRYWNLQDHIKRLHTDLAPTESKVIRYDSVSDEPTKSRKRKADSTDLEEAPKSNATRLAEISQLHESRLLERYHQHERRLVEIVKRLHDPRDASNMYLLWGATNCITVMAQTSERIKGVSTSGNFKQTNPAKSTRHSQAE